VQKFTLSKDWVLVFDGSKDIIILQANRNCAIAINDTEPAEAFPGYTLIGLSAQRDYNWTQEGLLAEKVWAKSIYGHLTTEVFVDAVDTGDATAAEILADLLTVDGTGSGLDADLLDGKHGNAYANVTHTHEEGDVIGLIGDLADIDTALTNKQPLDATLTALAAFNTSGLITQTAADTFTARTLTAGNAAVVITNGNGVAGNPTISLDATLIALANFNTTGLLTQTAADTFTGRTITGTANQITVANGAGTAGNPTLSLDPTDVRVPALLTTPNTGLHLLDTDASHDLVVKPGSNLTVDRTLTITTGDADRLLDISGGSVTITAAAATVLDDATVGAMLTTLGGIASTALDTDVSLAANSDAKIATQKATKAYVDQIVASQDAMVFKGVIDCSASPNYPAADRGWTYRVSVAGKIGGASGINVEVGDILLCLNDATASGNQATVGSSWSVIQANLDGALLTTSIGVTVQGFDATLAALAAFNTNGMLVQTAADTFTARSIAVSGTGISVSNGSGVAGNPTLSIDAGLQALGAFNTNGILVQTANDTFAGRTITGTANQITVSNGDGVLGNPTLSLDATLAALAALTITNGSFIRGTGADTFAVQAIIGSVSQSGGVATGAIFQSGSNANGEYVMYADGTMECWFVDTTGLDVNTLGAGNIYTSTTPATWTFPTPVPFVASKTCVTSSAYASARWGAAYGVTTTQCTYRQYSHTQSAVAQNQALHAIGRWF